VRNCAWTRDKEINADPNEILCESHRDKKGPQRLFTSDNPLELVVGGNFYQRKKKLFDQVVGFAKFSEFLVVAAVRYFLSLWGMADGNLIMLDYEPKSVPRTGGLFERKYVCNGPIPTKYAPRNSCTLAPLSLSLKLTDVLLI